VEFHRPTLSGWLSGKGVPADPKAFRRLVELLEPRAKKKTLGWVGRTPDEWEGWRQRAAAARRGLRAAVSGGSINVESPVSSGGTIPEQSIVPTGVINVPGQLPNEDAGTDAAAVSEQDLARRRAQSDPLLSALKKLDALPPCPTEKYDRHVLTWLLSSPEVTEAEAEADADQRFGARDADSAHEWEQQRRNLVRALTPAAVDIADPGLLELVDEIQTVLNAHAQLVRYSRLLESQVRSTTFDHAVATIKAFRRGAPVPEAPPAYRKALAEAEEAIADWNDQGQ
jgi:hypothetical protein